MILAFRDKKINHCLEPMIYHREKHKSTSTCQSIFLHHWAADKAPPSVSSSPFSLHGSRLISLLDSTLCSTNTIHMPKDLKLVASVQVSLISVSLTAAVFSLSPSGHLTDMSHTPLKLTQPSFRHSAHLCTHYLTVKSSQQKYTSPSLLIMSLKYSLNIQNMYLQYDNFMLMISCLNYYCGVI